MFKLTDLNKYKIVVTIFGASLVALFLKSFDNYGGDDGFFTLGFFMGLLAAILLFLIVAKFQLKKINTFLYTFLASLVVLPLFLFTFLFLRTALLTHQSHLKDKFKLSTKKKFQQQKMEKQEQATLLQ